MKAMAWRTVSAALACLAAACLVGPANAAGGSSSGGSELGSGATAEDPGKLYDEGLALYQRNQFRRAAEKFKAVLDVAPRNADVNYLYAMSLIGDGRGKSAIRPLERAIASGEAQPDAYKQLGLLQLQNGDRAKAEAQLSALTARQAACGAGCAAEEKAKYDAAVSGLKQALEGAPSTSGGSSWMPPSRDEGRRKYAEGVGLVQAHAYAAAYDAFKHAESAVGPHPDVLNYLGFTSRKLGRFDAALAYYQAALAIDPQHRGANEYLGELYLQMGRMEDARRQLAKLDRLCPFGCVEREELKRWMVASN